jgi:GntR family transcriptional repressor for pyruvate dehydrogenase complex
MMAPDRVIPDRVSLDEDVIAASFVPIRQLRAHEYVADQIRRHIGLRLLGPGEPLPPERELVRLFGVGRPTIQAALRLLEAEGLIETRRGRYGGSFVLDLGLDGGQGQDELVVRVQRRVDEVAELVEVRSVIEPELAGLAAERRGDADLAAIEAALAELEGAESEAAYMRADTALHLAIARASQNRLLGDVLEHARAGLNDAIALLPETQSWHERLNEEHAEIVDAVRRGDAATAREASRLHLARSGQSLLALVAVLRRRVGGGGDLASSTRPKEDA